MGIIWALFVAPGIGICEGELKVNVSRVVGKRPGATASCGSAWTRLTELVCPRGIIAVSVAAPALQPAKATVALIIVDADFRTDRKMMTDLLARKCRPAGHSGLKASKIFVSTDVP
jgi:hypothetical protein